VPLNGNPGNLLALLAPFSSVTHLTVNGHRGTDVSVPHFLLCPYSGLEERVEGEMGESLGNRTPGARKKATTSVFQ